LGDDAVAIWRAESPGLFFALVGVINSSLRSASMKTLNYPASLIMGLCMLLCGASAQAAVRVTHSVAAGASSDVVFARLNFDIGTNYPFTSFDMSLNYNPAKLLLELGLSSVKAGDNTYGLSAFISLLDEATEDLLLHTDPVEGMYSLGTYVMDPLLVTGPVEFVIALRRAPDFTAGTALVSYSGNISGNNEDSFLGEMNISAVPEPQTWLLWLGGLGLVLMQQARQRKLV
jgi:hypothetical protein